MDWATTWWEALPLFEKVLWCIAIPFSILTVLQVILEMLGAGDSGTDTGADGGMDMDMDAADGDISGGHVHGHDISPFNMFTVKGFIIFFTAFGWISLAAHRAGIPAFFSSLIGAFVGICCMALFAWIFRLLHSLSEEGNLQIKNAMAKKGTVYLKIPAQRSSKGKVTVSVQGALREFSAMTDGDEIPTGTPIQVIDVLGDSTLLVAKD